MADPLVEYQKSVDQNDALSQIASNLNTLGLPASLASWAWGEIQSGKSEAQVLLDLQQTPEFQKRFPAIQQLRDRAARGENVHVPTPGEYVQAEQTYTQVLRMGGLPQGFYDSQDDFTNLIAGQVSPAELQARVQDGYAKVMNAPPDVKQKLQDYYGVSAGGMAAYFLDPKIAPDVLARQASAAELGAIAGRSGYNDITAPEAERLARANVTDPQAEAAFGALAQEKQLFSALPGEISPTVTREQQLATVVAPHGAEQQQLDEIARRRKATFGGGGDFAAGTGGVSGLGSER